MRVLPDWLTPPAFQYKAECVGVRGQCSSELAHSRLQPPRVDHQVCPQCSDRHTSSICQPMQVEEAVLTMVPALWRRPGSGPHPNSCQKALSLRCYTTILLMRPYVVCTVYQPARAIATLRCIGKICAMCCFHSLAKLAILVVMKWC